MSMCNAPLIMEPDTATPFPLEGLKFFSLRTSWPPPTKDRDFLANM